MLLVRTGKCVGYDDLVLIKLNDDNNFKCWSSFFLSILSLFACYRAMRIHPSFINIDKLANRVRRERNNKKERAQSEWVYYICCCCTIARVINIKMRQYCVKMRITLQVRCVKSCLRIMTAVAVTSYGTLKSH